MLNPAVQIHLYRLYTCCITRSGLSALAIRPTQAQPLTTFHRKILRSFLHLSDRSPIPALHFLLGEITLEAKLHRDVFSLFYSLWSNPHTKVYRLVRHLLATSKDNSRTWSAHVRHLTKLNGLTDPLTLRSCESDPGCLHNCEACGYKCGSCSCQTSLACKYNCDKCEAQVSPELRGKHFL